LAGRNKRSFFDQGRPLRSILYVQAVVLPLPERASQRMSDFLSLLPRHGPVTLLSASRPPLEGQNEVFFLFFCLFPPRCSRCWPSRLLCGSSSDDPYYTGLSLPSSPFTPFLLLRQPQRLFPVVGKTAVFLAPDHPVFPFPSPPTRDGFPRRTPSSRVWPRHLFKIAALFKRRMPVNFSESTIRAMASAWWPHVSPSYFSSTLRPTMPCFFFRHLDVRPRFLWRRRRADDRPSLLPSPRSVCILPRDGSLTIRVSFFPGHQSPAQTFSFFSMQ